MVIADVIPNHDIVVQWHRVGGDAPFYYHYTTIDEDKGSPNVADYIRCDHDDDFKQDSFQFDNSIQGIEEYTQVKVWLYKKLIDGDGIIAPSPTVNIWVNGGWLVAKPISISPNTWESYTWAGLSGNQTSLNDLRVMVNAGMLSTGKIVDDQIFVYTMYAEITYTLAAVGYGHDFLGIPAANIDNIMGIPTANIDNICGL